MSLTIATTLNTDFDDAVQRTRAALAEVGFGVLTEIDMTATLKKKIDADIEDYVILGACNPGFAHRALQVERQIGALLPCNVTVRRNPENSGEIFVEAADPRTLMAAAGNDELTAAAEEVAELLSKAVASLS
ncbi:DUF302 domain-containing protein [Corynebacterium comes]|uniref:DUF302 domain-containing protein n=1 Tax=Corynebacterium comes TaxID=2675218 RepID=A0A6B8WG63_9CORY|nr:DUF302 domain-containing protein [Corynebacterium comes]QGU05638.1 hypothetical protein CETAM_12030 [Corynebacterium comes]